MKFYIEDPVVHDALCPECHSKFTQKIFYIYKKSAPFCVAWVDFHDHDGIREVYFDITFGTWAGDGPFKDHITFSCRYGMSAYSSDPVCTLVKTSRQDALFGKTLDRDAAHDHKLLPIFWLVVDELIKKDDSVRSFVVG